MNIKCHLCGKEILDREQLQSYQRMCYPTPEGIEAAFDPKLVPPSPSEKEAKEAFLKSRLEFERKMWYDKPENWKTDEEA